MAATLTRLTGVAAMAMLCACDCGASHGRTDAATSTDAGLDAPARDAGGPPDSGVLPEVTPLGPSCAELEPGPDRRCVEHGWFWMARWSTMTAYNGSTDVRGLPRPRQPIFLETFLVDATEVTVGAYRAFLAETDREPLPEECGYEDKEGELLDPYWVREVSQAVDARRDHPVVCVTRGEAAEYCAAQGGRLPTVAEWMRAGQEPHPAFRRFPWGDSPPPLGEMGWISGHPEFTDTHVAFTFYGDDVATVPVGSRAEGASPSGVLDLAGNASELLSDCAEQLLDTYGVDPAPRIRPAPSPTPTCATAVLVGGSNWRSTTTADLAGSQTVWQMADGPDSIRALEGDDRALGIGDSLSLERMWGWDTRPVDETVPSDGAGNLRRSWRIGFRCVYDP